MNGGLGDEGKGALAAAGLRSGGDAFPHANTQRARTFPASAP